MLSRHLLFLILAVPVSVRAADPPAPATLEAGLAGRWHGALGYRDYQSDALFELAVDTDIRALADGATDDVWRFRNQTRLTRIP